MNSDTYSFTTDLAWPWSLSGVGLPALAVVAFLLAALTIWTYAGNARAGGRRIALMVALRLTALLLAILALVRPSLAARENLRLPSTLLILLDRSESMTITDESNNYSRWEAMRRTVGKCDSVLKQLGEEQSVSVRFFTFADKLEEGYDPQAKADGKRTDFGEALHALFARHGSEPSLRGLILVSDGADNGTRYAPMAEADKWRGIACPIHTFAVGQTTTTSKQKDIIVLNIFPEPAPVPIKGKLTVKGLVDAPGFLGTTARVRLLVDDKEVAVKDEILAKETGNEVKLTTQAPDKPGEIKVTLKVDPQFGEVTHANNEVTTYVTVAKEGLSVLYADRLRPERIGIVRVLKKDPRIRLTELIRHTEDPFNELEKDAFDLDKQHYDVIIVGDQTPDILTGKNPALLERIRSQVQRGAGFLMTGGQDSFGAKWRNTPIAAILPVKLDEDGSVDGLVQMVPTAQGLDRYLLRLTDQPKLNAEIWERLPRLQEMSRLGTRKDTSVVLARASDGKDGTPLLVAGQFNEGRTLAFGGDTTLNWVKLGLPETREGEQHHARFWKQVVLWLAKQEEAAGNVWVKPDTRRLGSGGKLGFSVGARGANGEELPDVRFEVLVTNPQKAETPVTVTREADGHRGTFWKTELPGEYHMVVRAFVKDEKLQDEAQVRFLVYQDTAELARQAADYKFLADLAVAGGGKGHRLDELPRFLQELQAQPLAQGRRPKTDLYPDWRRSQTTAFLPGFILAFVALLCFEWFLRRYWGLV